MKCLGRNDRIILSDEGKKTINRSEYDKGGERNVQKEPSFINRQGKLLLLLMAFMAIVVMIVAAVPAKAETTYIGLDRKWPGMDNIPTTFDERSWKDDSWHRRVEFRTTLLGNTGDDLLDGPLYCNATCGFSDGVFTDKDYMEGKCDALSKVLCRIQIGSSKGVKRSDYESNGKNFGKISMTHASDINYNMWFEYTTE